MMKVGVSCNICLKHLNMINKMKSSINMSLLNVKMIKYSRALHSSSASWERAQHNQYIRAVLLKKFGKPDQLEVIIRNKPYMLDDMMLIRVEAAGINPVDTYIREGIYKVLPQIPAVLGKEISGTIEGIGKKAVNKYKLKVGDRVFARLNANGGYAEYVCTSGENVYPLKGNLSFSQGASIYVTYYTAYRALVLRAAIDISETLFIHGASGGVGTAALQLAKYLGVQKIGATAGTEEGMKMLKDLGADFVFNHRKKGHIHEAKLAMGNTGFDVILENFADVYLGDDCNVLAPGGRILVVGCRGSTKITPRSLMATEGEILGVNLGHFTEEELVDCSNFIIDGMEIGWVNPVIGREYKLEEASQAHEDMIYKSASFGKLVFKMDHKLEYDNSSLYTDVSELTPFS